MKIQAVEAVQDQNREFAEQNRTLFQARGVLAVNVMASPGAGKTSLILGTCARLGLRPAVIEGDVATRIDADAIAARGIPVAQINTGGSCHLEAWMVARALQELPVDDCDVLFIENVGNLICPVAFDLGAGVALALASVPEGHDKPAKYPALFARADVVVLNKCDLVEACEFDLAAFRQSLRVLNPEAPLFCLSCRSEAGLDEWCGWLKRRRSLSGPGAAS